jgi:hypothetical protein
MGEATEEQQLLCIDDRSDQYTGQDEYSEITHAFFPRKSFLDGINYRLQSGKRQ